MIELKVDTDYIKAVARNMQEKWPKILSWALNRTAVDVRTYLVATLPRYFTMRTKFVQAKMLTNFSNKQNLIVEIGNTQDFMRLQAYGGEKKFKTKDVAVPMTGPRVPRRDVKARVSKSKWPSKLLENKKDYFLGIPSKPGQSLLPLGVWKRIRSPPGAKNPIDSVRLQYRMHPEVKIDPAWPFDEIVTKVVNARFVPNVDFVMKKMHRR